MIFVVGGGGFSTKNAVIHANAPLGSTITFSKGGVVVKSLGPTDAFSNADGATADYYYPVKATNYGEWTVVASSGNYSSSKVITVSEVKQYDAILEYSLYLFNHGDQCTAVTGGWKTIGGTISDDSMVINSAYGMSGHLSLFTNNKINSGGRTVLKVKFVPENDSGGGTIYQLHAGLSNQNTSVGTSGMIVNYVTNYSGQYNSEVIYTIDISANISIPYYIQFDIVNEKATIYEVWMEW